MGAHSQRRGSGRASAEQSGADFQNTRLLLTSDVGQRMLAKVFLVKAVGGEL